jgi:hypothetical protein
MFTILLIWTIAIPAITAYTTINRINAGMATLKLSEWIEIAKCDMEPRSESANEIPSMYTMAGSMYRKSLREGGRIEMSDPVTWTRYALGDEIIVMGDETIPVKFSIEDLEMTTDTYIGVGEICMGKNGNRMVSLQQLVAHPNLWFLQTNSFSESPVDGYGVAFKHALVESATKAGMDVDLHPLMKWDNGRHFLQLNEDILL